MRNQESVRRHLACKSSDVRARRDGIDRGDNTGDWRPLIHERLLHPRLFRASYCAG